MKTIIYKLCVLLNEILRCKAEFKNHSSRKKVVSFCVEVSSQ